MTAAKKYMLVSPYFLKVIAEMDRIDKARARKRRKARRRLK